MRQTLILTALSCAALSAAWAEGPHEHGVGNLNIAVEGSTLLIDLEIPGADIVGFEHKPKNDQDIAAVQDGLEILGAPDQLFAPSAAAACALESATVDTDLLATEHDEHGHDEHGHHEHGHDEHGHDEHGHDEHGHDEHGHDEHGHDEDGHDAHGSFRAVFEYACASPDALDRVETLLFSLFPTLESLRVQSVGPDGQSASVLTRDSTVLRL